MERLICIVIGYIFGLIQSGYLYGKVNHMDIRQYGSGNAGSTNVLRVMGKKAGAIVFLGDFFKAVFAMAVAVCCLREMRTWIFLRCMRVWESHSVTISRFT